MRTRNKVVLAVLIAAPILVGLASVALRAVGRYALETHQRGWEEGAAFGKGGIAKRACEQEALARGDRCGLNPDCRLAAGAFAEGCMSGAPKDDPLCDGFPPASDVVQSQTWQAARCLGSRHQSCESIATAVAAHCDRVARLR